ncbi:hypothetical protein FRC05_001184 [Tulasnella sp. 425]|nr:hypothetical protein FRC05_001184 [Tulasnella sp. 425]
MKRVDVKEAVEHRQVTGLAIRFDAVQIQTGATAHSGSSGGDSVVKHVMNPLKGFLAVSSACVTSDLAGVYFEMVLKRSQSYLRVRNVQLFLIHPPSNPRPRIILRKLDITIFRRVFGALVTAAATKYANNIMKGFATSLITTRPFLASVALFDFSITVPFAVRSSIVPAATWFYNLPAAEKLSGVVHEKLGGEEGSGMRAKLSSLSLKGSGRKSANVPGSPVDPSQPSSVTCTQRRIPSIHAQTDRFGS